MRQINVYKYDELPTEEAKIKARQWWINAEYAAPAWIDDHIKSMDCAIKAVSDVGDLGELKDVSSNCGFTGYCADALLSDLIVKIGRRPRVEEVRAHYERAWEKELDERTGDIEYIEETITVNEYEFLDDGTFYRGARE